MTPKQLEELQQLISPPNVSWSVILLWVSMLGTYIAASTLAVLEVIPLWIGMFINSIAVYYAFGVIHDGIHFAICCNKHINNWITQSTTLLVAPYVSLSLFRWGHLQHHRFINHAKDDPDYAPYAWLLPIRWAFLDIAYLIYALKHRNNTGSKYLRTSIPWIAGSIIVISILIMMGYGLEILMLWFIPSRIILIILSFTFFWIPHVPQTEYFTKVATSSAYKKLMALFLQWRHYHLIHHLYPSAPFFNNEKIWKLLEPQLRTYDFDLINTMHV